VAKTWEKGRRNPLIVAEIHRFEKSRRAKAREGRHWCRNSECSGRDAVYSGGVQAGASAGAEPTGAAVLGGLAWARQQQQLNHEAWERTLPENQHERRWGLGLERQEGGGTGARISARERKLLPQSGSLWHEPLATVWCGPFPIAWDHSGRHGYRRRKRARLMAVSDTNAMSGPLSRETSSQLEPIVTERSKPLSSIRWSWRGPGQRSDGLRSTFETSTASGATIAAIASVTGWSDASRPCLWRGYNRLYQPAYPMTGLAQERWVREAMRSGICMSLFQALRHATRIAS
jgi:hypothetical protein